MERKLEVLGEAAGDIPPEVQVRHPEVAWKQIVRFRDVLAHHYFGLDDDVIWVTVRHDLPVLIQQIHAVLRANGPAG